MVSELIIKLNHLYLWCKSSVTRLMLRSIIIYVLLCCCGELCIYIYIYIIYTCIYMYIYVMRKVGISAIHGLSCTKLRYLATLHKNPMDCGVIAQASPTTW